MGRRRKGGRICPGDLVLEGVGEGREGVGRVLQGGREVVHILREVACVVGILKEEENAFPT